MITFNCHCSHGLLSGHNDFPEARPDKSGSSFTRDQEICSTKARSCAGDEGAGFFKTSAGVPCQTAKKGEDQTAVS